MKQFLTGTGAAACCAGLAIALFALIGVGTAAAAVPQTRLVAEDGVDSGDCTVDPCATIQYAVDETDPGDIVDVAAGTYDEPQVIVDKPLTLHGDGPGQTIVDGSSASGLASNGLFRFDSPAVGDISVSGFTLEGANGENAGGEALLMLFSGVPAASHVIVTQNELLASEALDPDLATDWSLGIYVSGSAADIDVQGNLFEGMWQGILVEHSTGATVIAGNEFADMVSTTSGPDTFAGEGVLVLATGTSGGAGDLITSPQVVSNNYFHGYAGFGVAVQSGHHSVNPTSLNTFTNVVVAENEIALDGATFPTTGRPLGGVILKTDHALSTIEDAEVFANTISVSAPGNDIAVEGAVTGTEAYLNRLAGDPAAGLDASVAAGPVDATDNWWGCNDGPGAPDCVTESGNVDSAPNLVLSGAASAAKVEPGRSATVTAGLTTNSDGEAVDGVPDEGSPVIFEAGLGSMAPEIAPLAHGVASSTFTAGAQPGEARVTASLDNQTVSVPLAVAAPPAPTPPTPEPTPVPPVPVESPPVVKTPSPDSTKTVPSNGQVIVGTVSCPSGTCDVAAKSPKVTIGGKAYKVTVKVPRQVAAGSSAPIKIVLSRAARAALAKEGKGRLTVKITVSTANGATKTVTVSVKLTGKKQKEKGH